MIDVNEQCKRILELVFTRFREKVEKEDDPQTAILVYVSSAPSLPFWYRSQLLEQTRKYLREQYSKEQRPRLYGVYYCYEAN